MQELKIDFPDMQPSHSFSLIIEPVFKVAKPEYIPSLPEYIPSLPEFCLVVVYECD